MLPGVGAAGPPAASTWGNDDGRPRCTPGTVGTLIGPSAIYQSRELLLMAMRKVLVRWSGMR
ncbi:hypothetical protein GCM10010274_63390 [Streptomyces lavendofoliae]|uniref:Uncharacterized protein n=1 Tax=Streptomyces lavendofoliae TaxID=67314 RepID=A0A918M780_9ACTN|nr:hypothetical protein GCM10010274_63390 [Streptomyces lavendofoliae]